MSQASKTKCISEEQATFAHGGQISDNIIITKECIKSPLPTEKITSGVP